MHELALMAATEWARANADKFQDAAEFGRRAAQAYLAASATHSTAGDEALAAAALAARANALELAAVLGRRYVGCGTVFDGALALADKLASSEGYGRAVELIFRAGTTPSAPSFESWADLIEAADAVDAWIRTGDLPADPSLLQQVFPSVAVYR